MDYFISDDANLSAKESDSRPDQELTDWAFRRNCAHSSILSSLPDQNSQDLPNLAEGGDTVVYNSVNIPNKPTNSIAVSEINVSADGDESEEGEVRGDEDFDDEVSGSSPNSNKSHMDIDSDGDYNHKAISSVKSNARPLSGTLADLFHLRNDV